MKRIFQLTQFTCILAWVVLGVPPTPIQSSQSHPLSEETASLPPPPPQGEPQGKKPGGRRPGCPMTSTQTLTPLVIVKEQPDERLLPMGLTRQERPTFWVYVPYEEEQIAGGKLKFSLRDRGDQIQYEQEFNIRGKSPGVIGITLPVDAPALDPEQWYQWYVFVDVYCSDDPYATPGKETISAWVIHKDISSSEDFEENFVYDRLSAIAQSEDSEERQQQWLQFLQVLGLEQERLADKCCTILDLSAPISNQ